MRNLMLLLLLTTVQLIFSQKKITGTVKDDFGEPIIGVNVIEKNTKNGVVTDFNGKYEITVSEGATLVFSYIGFKSTQKTTENNLVDVVLIEGQQLQEVSITGSRVPARSNTSSPLPVDVFSYKVFS